MEVRFGADVLPLCMRTELGCLMSGLIAGCLLVAGCGVEGHSQLAPPRVEDEGAATDAMMLDGQFADWDAEERGWSDGRWLWLRFVPETRPTQAIQAASYTTRIRIDADLDARTGAEIAYPRSGNEAIGVQPQGVDLLIEFSPVNEQGGIGIGSGVRVFDTGGDERSIGHNAIGMACLPTYSSAQYEMRIDRLAAQSGVLPESGMIEVVVDQVDETGKTLWWEKFVVELPQRDARETLRDLEMPAKAAGGVRVMSANVLYSSPLQEPESFKRILDSAQPDVILYQEWFRAERAQVEAWVGRYAGPEWTLHFPNERGGVAIATRHPIVKAYDETLLLADGERSTRVCAALIDTDAGELLAISVHLKCCGAAGSEEDLTRIDQAKAINAFVDQVHAQHPEAMVIIGGDYNLVGSRVPLEVMARGLGIGGDDLDAVAPGVLGDSTLVTWVDEKSRFSPGRLDWMLYDDSRSLLVEAFMIDTRVLSDASLSAMGLERGDSRASDHLPMIVDLKRAP